MDELLKNNLSFKFNSFYFKQTQLFQIMYRNTPTNLNYTTSFQSYQSRPNSLSKTGTQFNQTRYPLYPIGPTISQQEFNPIRRTPSPSPYLTLKQGIKPPSYQQRYLRTDVNFMLPQRGSIERSYNFQSRQKQLIERNQTQIKQEQKRRQNLRQSYERQIENLTRVLHKNLDRKQQLLLEISVLEKANQEYIQKAGALVPPKQNLNLYQSLDRKQQDIIVTKNKLLSDIREKQDAYMKQEEEQQEYWQNQIREKQKILFRTQQQLKNKKIQLLNIRMIVEKPDYVAIEDQIREQKFQDFLYDAKVIEDKIENLIKQRQQQHRQVDECLKTKRLNVQTLQLKHEEKYRECTTSRMRTEQLERVSKQMQSVNNNLLHELERKQKMIEKFQIDIYSLKQRKDQQQNSLSNMLRTAREDQMQQEEMQKDIQLQIVHVQQLLRTESSANNKLRAQYQKLYEILCSTISRNVHQTFKSTISS